MTNQCTFSYVVLNQGDLHILIHNPTPFYFLRYSIKSYHKSFPTTNHYAATVVEVIFKYNYNIDRVGQK